MKSNPVPKLILLALLAAMLVPVRVQAGENITNTIDFLREIYRSDRQAYLADRLQLTESEGAAFWPLYQSYRAEMENLGDGLVKLVLEYADYYPDVPEDRAALLLKQYTALERKLVDKRELYLKRAEKVLPASKVLRWAQLENRMDMALRLQLAANVPVIPTNKSKP